MAYSTGISSEIVSGELTDAELLATIFLCSEPPQVALQLSQTLLKHFGGMHGLLRQDFASLTAAGKLTAARANVLLAAFELMHRIQKTDAREMSLGTAAGVAAYVTPRLAHLQQEVLLVLFLNRSNDLLAEKELARGGVGGVVIDPKVIFKEAVTQLASAIIVCHNHPSGSITPSPQDREITRKLSAAGRVLEIALLDHLIISYKGYYSFADHQELG